MDYIELIKKAFKKLHDTVTDVDEKENGKGNGEHKAVDWEGKQAIIRADGTYDVISDIEKIRLFDRCNDLKLIAPYYKSRLTDCLLLLDRIDECAKKIVRKQNGANTLTNSDTPWHTDTFLVLKAIRNWLCHHSSDTIFLDWWFSLDWYDCVTYLSEERRCVFFLPSISILIDVSKFNRKNYLTEEQVKTVYKGIMAYDLMALNKDESNAGGLCVDCSTFYNLSRIFSEEYFGDKAYFFSTAIDNIKHLPKSNEKCDECIIRDGLTYTMKFLMHMVKNTDIEKKIYTLTREWWSNVNSSLRGNTLCCDVLKLLMLIRECAINICRNVGIG